MNIAEKTEITKKQKKELDDIIANKRVYPVFQPIVNLMDGEIHGYEALSRILKPDYIEDTETLFQIALCQERTWELEKLCRKRIISRYSDFAENMKKGKLFINVNPMVLMDESFKANFTRKQLEKYGVCPEKIVIEITERNSVDNLDKFINAVQHYKHEGYQIAIDDIGSCYSGLNIVCNTHPHYLKVDIQLVRDIDRNHMKYAIVKGLVEMARSSGISVLAEGIETKAELTTLIELGVTYGQGYFLGRPKTILSLTDREVKDFIHQSKKQIDNFDWIYKSADKDYQMVSIEVDDYKSYEEYVKLYGDEKATDISKRFFSHIRTILCDCEILKVVSELKCIVIMEKNRCDDILEQINECFEQIVETIYDDNTLNRGYTERITKKGKVKKISLLKLKMTVDNL